MRMRAPAWSGVRAGGMYGHAIAAARWRRVLGAGDGVGSVRRRPGGPGSGECRHADGHSHRSVRRRRPWRHGGAQESGQPVRSNTNHRRQGPVRVPEPRAECVPHDRHPDGVRDGRARRDRPDRGPGDGERPASPGWHVDDHRSGRQVGHHRDQPDGPHRSRSGADGETAARVLVLRVERDDHARLAGRRRRFERLLPSARRPRADAVLGRQPAGHRSAEPDLFEPDFTGRRAVDGGDHRRAAGRIRRQGQPRRTRHHEIGPWPVEADRQRLGQLRLVQQPQRRSDAGRRIQSPGQLPVSQRAGHRSLPRFAGVLGPARSWKSGIDLRSPRLAARSERHAPSQRAARAVVVPGAE